MTAHHHRPIHHPGGDLLLAYATGSCEDPVSLVLATHLALCPQCRSCVSRLEALGGALLEGAPPGKTPLGSPDALMARLDEAPPAWLTDPAPMQAGLVDKTWPSPLRDYLGGGLETLDWRSYPGLEEAELLPETGGFRTRLMRIRAGTALPLHTHTGLELVLVLTGSFSDANGHYLRGDLAESGPSVEHRPIADPGDTCICLVVTSGRLRLTGPIGRLANPFLNI